MEDNVFLAYAHDQIKGKVPLYERIGEGLKPLGKSLIISNEGSSENYRRDISNSSLVLADVRSISDNLDDMVEFSTKIKKPIGVFYAFDRTAEDSDSVDANIQGYIERSLMDFGIGSDEEGLNKIIRFVKANDKVYPNGELVGICQISQHSIIRSFDEGLLKGFKVPLSKFRRIPFKNLVEFMKENGMYEYLKDNLLE